MDTWLFLSTCPLMPAELPKPSWSASSAVMGFMVPLPSWMKTLLLAELLPSARTHELPVLPDAVLLGPAGWLTLDPAALNPGPGIDLRECDLCSLLGFDAREDSAVEWVMLLPKSESIPEVEDDLLCELCRLDAL